MAGRKQREKKKTENEDGSLKEESSLKDRLLESGGEGLTPSIERMKKKNEMHEANDEDATVSSSLTEGNIDVNNAADMNKKKKKKKSERHEACGEGVAVSSSLSEVNVDVNKAAGRNEKKRKLEHGNDEKGSQVARKKNKVSEIREVLEETHIRIEENMGLQKNVQVDLVSNFESEVRRDRKRNQNEKNREDGTSTIASVVNILDDNRREEVVEVQNGPESEGIAKMNIGEGRDREKEKKKKQKKHGGGGDDNEVIKSVADGKDAGREESTEIVQDKKEKKKKKKQKYDDGGGDTEVIKSVADGKDAGTEESTEIVQDEKEKKKKKKQKKHDGGGNTEVIESLADGKDVGSEKLTEIVQDEGESSKKEKKKRKERHNIVQEAASMQIMAETLGNQSSVIEGDVGNTSFVKNKARDGKLKVNAKGGNKRRKKAKSLGNGSKGKSSKRGTQVEKDVETTGPSEKSSSKLASKRVSFSEDVEVFPLSDGSIDEKAVGEDGLVRGKRFSHEEDEMVKKAVLNYIDAHGLGSEGLNMVLNCKKHPAIVHCWKEIGAALPWRPRESVYYRAHILFERDQNSSWTPEEYELIRKFHEKHGSDWKTLAEALGKHRFHVKDTWRRIKLINMKKGKWSQDEYQSLFDLVNLDLRLKIFEERKTKHGMLRDNISWTAISEKLETRTDALCCQKWYEQLTSPMVAEGKWLDIDDYRLLMELYDLDACCMEDVDWDNLLEHRSGDLCRKRWNQMVKHLGDHRNKSFADQVDVLINRYCPDVLEAREAYNSKPAVD